MKIVNVLWTDLGGIRRSRCVVYKGGGDPIRTKIGQICFTLPSFADVASSGVPGLPASGEFVVQADAEPTGFRYFQAENVTTVLGNVLNEEGTPSLVCGRNMLRSAVAELNDRFTLDVLVGFELEFLLVHRENDAPIDNQVYAASHALIENHEVLVDIVKQLDKNGIDVLQFHGESAHGQYELALAPYPALESADKVTIAKEVIHAVAKKHGLKASFVVKFDMQQAANSQHCHIGLVDALSKKRNKFAHDEVMTSEGEHFMSGVLEHLPALLALTTSSANSFRRLQPHCWAGCFQCWGTQNRETPIRVITNPMNNFEVKAFDATANVYVGLSGIIHAGIHGLEKKMKLPENCQIDPATAPPGTYKRLPESIPQALEALKKDTFLVGKLSPTFVGIIEDLRMKEHNYFETKVLQDECKILFNKY